MDRILIKTLQETLSEEIKKSCFGCQFDCGSQKDHDLCLDLTNYQQVERYYDGAWARIDFKQFAELFKEYFRHKLFLSALTNDGHHKSIVKDTVVQSFYTENSSK